MAYKKALPEKLREIAVSDVFINEYMPDASGSYVKVYLLGLSQCMKEKPMSLSQIADKLSMLESDVIRAWNFWADKKVVKFDGENVEFIELEKPVMITETKPVYYPDEIVLSASSNKQIADMFVVVEKILTKPLSSADLTVLYSLYDFYRMPIDVIPMLVTYCVANGKKSMRQIEKTAGKWIEKGIDSVESAENYLKKVEEHNKIINKIKNSVGIIDRNFSPTEIKYINGWLYDLKMPFEMIMKAFDLCAANTGKFSVKYMDKVLTDWHNDGKKSMIKDKENKSNATPTKFTNFDQREYDYDAFERKSLGKAGNK